MVKGGSRVNGLGGRDYCIQHEYPVVKILLYHLISGTWISKVNIQGKSSKKSLTMSKGTNLLINNSFRTL